MNVVSIATCFWMVRALIACCVTILCLALAGRDCAVVGGVRFLVPFLVDMRLVESSCCASAFGIGCTLLKGGNPPGVLFLVALSRILGVDFSARLEVGLHACIIGGVLVM